MILTEIETALNDNRLSMAATDTSLGMAFLFEDRPAQRGPIGLFTVAFCKEFCRENPGYVWRKI